MKKSQQILTIAALGLFCASIACAPWADKFADYKYQLMFLAPNHGYHLQWQNVIVEWLAIGILYGWLFWLFQKMEFGPFRYKESRLSKWFMATFQRAIKRKPGWDLAANVIALVLVIILIVSAVDAYHAIYPPKPVYVYIERPVPKTSTVESPKDWGAVEVETVESLLGKPKRRTVIDFTPDDVPPKWEETTAYKPTGAYDNLPTAAEVLAAKEKGSTNRKSFAFEEATGQAAPQKRGKKVQP